MKVDEPAFYHTRITDWPEGERPREKLMNLGPSALTDAELLAILIRTGSRRQTALDLAKLLLSRFGALPELSVMDHQEFFRLKGIGPAKAITLIAAFEIARRIASASRPQRIKITGPEDVFRRFEPLLAHLKKEVFMILVLNSANVLMREIKISEGILNSSLVHPREVFKQAILESAASIILMHNHPSGEVQPSQEDKAITRRLVESGRLLDIPVLDHLIIGQGRFFSFRDAGLIAD
ncbi:MAG: JAB domain-containing protein [Calditrichaeota bacterium]|nr:MAG: JAB domain-containing protein [Calditrichota bacterium]